MKRSLLLLFFLALGGCQVPPCSRATPDAPPVLPDANCGTFVGAPCCAGARCAPALECRDFASGSVCCNPAALGECQ